MPVIVVGADTPLGSATVDALLPRPSEVRAFVTSPAAAAELRNRGVKVALGDVSDGSHVGGAALNAFCAVLIEQAAHDERERAFADTPQAVVAAWLEGIGDAGVSRTIYVGDDIDFPTPAQPAYELATVATTGRTPAEVAQQVAALEEVAELPDTG